MSSHDDREVPTVIQAGGRVLIVEDNEVNQVVASRMVHGLGYTVEVAASGVEAVDAVLANEYAAVLMDCQMPVMDGFRATEEIRRREPPDRHTPVIALTTGAMRGDGQRCLDAGMDDYITKPVLRRDLTEVLGRWTSSSPASTTGRLSGPSPVTGAVLDAEVVDELKRIDREGGGIGEVVRLFIRTAIERLEGLRAAAAAGDGSALEQGAHSLRGSSATFGGRRVAALCATLESASRAGELGSAAELVEHLGEELAALRAALDEAFAVPRA